MFRDLSKRGISSWWWWWWWWQFIIMIWIIMKYENFNGENTVKILIMSKTTWPRSAAFLSFAYLFGSKSSPTYVWLHIIIIITIKVIIMSICIFSQRHYSQSFHHQEYHRWNYLITKLLVSVKVISLIGLILGAFILSNGKSWLLWDHQLKHRGDAYCAHQKRWFVGKLQN